jgi:2-dehydro-3-deoxyphosphogluconate aldolase/(4S)-4-hydroxy-2-oxoglutarate aldolase
MHEVLLELGKHRIVPVVAIDDAGGADALGEALVSGGLPVAEITFRTDAAEASIRTLAKRGDLLVGAGTVLNVDTVKRAVDAGAKFIVSPGFNPKVVGYCVEQKILITPGIATPTEIEMALDHGLSVVKFFPAESIGGIKTLKAFSAPYGMIKFIPTGGVGPDNLMEYLKFPKVLACGGSWMVGKELLSGKQFDRVQELTRQAVSMVKQS